MGMKNFKLLLAVCISASFLTNSAFAEENIIEIKDLKGGVKKIESAEKPLPGVVTQQEESTVLKGRIENKAEFHVLNEIQLNINDVTGPGKASSSLSDGVKYMENMNLYGKGNLGEFDYQFNLGGRATNDDRIDPRSMTVTSLQGKAQFRDHILSAGDVFESFSQYSLNTNLKGTSYKFYNNEDSLPDVTLIYGYAYPRWDSFFRATNARAMQRIGYGLNLRHDFTPNFDAGFSFLRSQDDERQFTSESLYDNNIYSIDFEYRPIPGLTVRGETAYSHADRQIQDGDPHSSYFGHAHRIEAIGDGGPSRVTLEYERVSPKFETLLGSAAQDREKFKARWKYKYNKNITFNTAFMWFMNNLNDADERTHNYKPEFGVNVKRLFNRRYSDLDLVFKFDRRTGSGTRAFDHFTTLNYRDRFGFLDLDQSLGFTSFNTNKDRREAYEYNYHTSLSSRHNFKGIVFKPSVNAGTYFIDDTIFNTTDKIVEYSAGLGLDIPKHKITSNWKFGQNMLNSGQGDNSNKMFTNISIY